MRTRPGCAGPVTAVPKASRGTAGGRLREKLASTAGRAVGLHLAAVEAKFSLNLPPAVPRLAFGTAVTGPAQPGRVLIHHVGQGGDAGRQAETLKARSDLLPSLFNGCHRDYGGRCGRFFHGVALLRGFSTPSLQAQGGQRLPSYFNIERDIASATEDRR